MLRDRRHCELSKGLRLDVAELGALSFCGQVRAVYGARVVVGVFGAAIGGNLIFTRDTATTVELTACGRSAPRAPDAGMLGHTFQPLAAAYAYGFVSFCLCVDDPGVDLAAKRSTRRGWFRSERLGANVGALASAVARALDGASENGAPRGDGAALLEAARSRAAKPGALLAAAAAAASSPGAPARAVDGSRQGPRRGGPGDRAPCAHPYVATSSRSRW